VDFRILGRLEVREGDRDLTPQRAKARALLGLLLLHRNQRVPTDRIIEDLWGEDPPATADKALQGHVSALRKLLGAARIRTEPGGYRLEVQPDEIDLERFARALTDARGAADPGARLRLLGEALGTWRGEPLADLADERFAQPEIARLQALRLAAEEERIDAELALGRHAQLLPDLDRLVQEHPLRETLRAKLMVALYRAGRQSAALGAYQDGRRRLAEDLGIDPASELQLLERQILAHDPALDLPAAAPERGPVRQERKTVTVLVIEVVPAGASDPEDLERAAQPALERIRELVEGVGGSAEPLFANALLGMFGAARAHDDDALRAVRAALDLMASPERDGVQVRGGIETGEALVTIDGDEVAVTGQVLGAASRLQASAALGSIVVGAVTRRATEKAIDYRSVADDAWQPLGLRPVHADEQPGSLFVGRSDELGQLERIFARSRDGRTTQLATIVAEPGGGKTRLLRELRRRLEDGDEVDDGRAALRWLQGRCLPYGHGLTFWALGAVVREWAGILESDDADASAAKLHAAVAALEPDEDRRAWLARNAAPLVGIEDSVRAGDREQGFAAWRHLIEAIAGDRPLVVAFEDIHWADEALLAFVDHLVDRAADVPLVVLCTARPELHERSPSWGAGKRNAATILLAPLSEADTTRLLETLLGRPAEPRTVRRASGNPLFAQELAHLIADPATEPDHIPETLQAVIAAHLDALPHDLKAVAASAAVVGEVFWPGVVAEIGGIDRPTVEARLHRLVANEVVRRRRRSTVAGQDEFEFLHVLVRDVAYGQIPRRDRIARHRTAAAWIERLAESRPTAHAELAAHHYAEALAIAERLGDETQVVELRPLAVTSLALAGDGARTLDVARAAALYQRALDHMDPGDPMRGSLLARLGDVAQLAGDLERADTLTRTAVDALVATGDVRAAAAAMVSLESVSWRLGGAEADRRALLRDAVGLLEALPPGPELVHAYAQLAAHELYGGSSTGCLAWSSKALALAEALGLPALQFQPRHYLGIARFEQGDVRGIADVRAAIELGLEAGLTWETAHAQADLGAMVWLQEGPGRAIPLKQAAAAFAADRGMAALAETTRGQTLWMHYDAGAWDLLLEEAGRLVAAESKDRGRVAMIAHSTTARVLAGRGRVAEARPLADDVLARGRAVGDAQDLDPSLATAAYVASAASDGRAALDLIEEMEARSRGLDLTRRAHDLALVARICLDHDAPGLARAFLPDEDRPAPTRGKLGVATARATVAEAAGDLEDARAAYAAAASGWATYGCLEEEAYALLGEARCAGAGTPSALAAVTRAEGIGRGLGAVRLIEESARMRERRSPRSTGSNASRRSNA
jgi:DNA-binding SARP family transcriptional activator